MPEAAVNVGSQLVVASKQLHRLALPDSPVALYQVADGRRQKKKPAIDPAAVILRLLAKTCDAVCINGNRPEALRRPHHSDRRFAAMSFVKRNLGGEVDVRDAVAVG